MHEAGQQMAMRRSLRRPKNISFTTFSNHVVTMEDYQPRRGFTAWPVCFESPYPSGWLTWTAVDLCNAFLHGEANVGLHLRG